MAEARDQAEAALTAKSTLVSHVTHELRTPLAGVASLLDMALETELNSHQRGILEKTKANTRHLLQLITVLLDQSRAEHQSLELAPKTTCLRAPLDRALDLVSPSAQLKSLALHANVDIPDNTWAELDALRLTQLLVNLLGNAIKFTEHGHVALEAHVSPGATESESRLHIIVSNTGPGMSEEVSARIFEPFEQASHEVARTYGGTGLGLTITRSIVERMGGMIRVASEPGAGAEFHVELPITRTAAPSQAEPCSSASHSNEPLRGLRVRAAEDNAVIQQVLAHHLETLGAQATLVEDGRAALAAEGSWDVVLLDVQMPHVDGLTVARQLRDRGVTTPIVGFTAHESSEQCAACLAAGMDDVLTKPVSRSVLAETLARHTHRGSYSSEAAS